ncbi:DDB1- and CUL4-associated factor 8 [Clonorchis sinensis]|uniref:DDB1- and CUL4-associated factor 8 n=1 Tax=Clonorchis sinensis TaxID=79923 RepID=A0A8T1MXI5_CLOSI|nr:DDB1- and CUL4-associated factor 8 [Clonorchis sinensis]
MTDVQSNDTASLDDALVSTSSDEDYTSMDTDMQWTNGVNSLNSFNMTPKDGDYEAFKKQLRRDLRIGSAYHIGSSRFPRTFSSAPYSTLEVNNQQPVTTPLVDKGSTPPLPTPAPATTDAFLRHPFNLILAREQGDIGPAPKSRRIRYKASRWRCEGSPRIDGLQLQGHRERGTRHSDPQTFSELIQGSLWAVSRLHLENKFKCHRGCVNALTFNSSGNLIASGSDDLKVVVTNWITKEQVAKYSTGHAMNIFHVKFLPETNDTKIVSCACDSEVRLAELASDGSLVGSPRLLVAHNRSCHKLALPHGEPHIVLSAGADGQVFSIDVRTPKADNILWLPFSEFFSIASNPIYPNEVALCGRNESIIRIYDRRKMDGRDPRSGYLHCFGATHLRSFGRRTPPVFPAGLDDSSPSDQTNPFGDADSSDASEADEMDVDSDNFLHSLSAQLGRRVRAVLNGLRGRAQVAFRFTNGRGEGTTTTHPSYNLESSKYSVTAAVYSNQGDAILASYNDEDIYLFDTRRPSSPYLHKYSGHRNMQTIVSATFFGPNSEYVVSGSDDGFFYVWDRESEGIVQWLHADADGAVNVIESHPTLPVLASAGLDFDFKVWSPSRPLLVDSDDEFYSSHLKYTFSKVAPDIRRLRRSQLAKALSSDSDSHTRTELEQEQNGGSRDSTPTNDATSSLPVPHDTAPSTLSDGPTGVSADCSPPVPALCSEITSSSSSTTLSSACKRLRRSSSPDDDARENVTVEEVSTQSGDGEVPSTETRPSVRRQRKKTRKRHSSETSADARLPEKRLQCTKTERTDKEASGGNPTAEPDQVQPVLPQFLLPFNRNDLELRVAQNWINRTSERTQLDGLEEADSQLLSAIESMTQLHARAAHRRASSRHNGTTGGGGGGGSTDDDDDDDDDDDSGILGSFLFFRRPRRAAEQSEETFATRDREGSANGTSSNSSWVSTQETSNEFRLTRSSSSSSSTSATSTSSSSSPSSTSSSSSPSTAVGEDSSSSAADSHSEDRVLVELLNLESAATLTSESNSTSGKHKRPSGDVDDLDDVD